MLNLNEPDAINYHTTGQVARILRVSVSTLKRWLEEFPSLAGNRQNASGWRLFTTEDVEQLKEHQKKRRRTGKVFKPGTLRPIDG